MSNKKLVTKVKQEVEPENEIDLAEVSAYWNELTKEAGSDPQVVKKSVKERKPVEKSQIVKKSVKKLKPVEKSPKPKQPVKSQSKKRPPSANLRDQQQKIKQETYSIDVKPNVRIVFDDVKPPEVKKITAKTPESIPPSNIESVLAQLESDVLSSERPHSHCLLRQRMTHQHEKKWFEEVPKEVLEQPTTQLTRPQFDRLTAICNKMLDVEVSTQFKTRRRSADGGWSHTVLKKGTAADRVAALAVSVQESPAHNLVALKELIQMCEKKTRRDVMTVIASLEELFVDFLLPDRKLRSLFSCPLVPLASHCGADKVARDRLLILFAFEAKLKDTYAEFVTLLGQQLMNDEILVVKKRSISCALNLLKSKQELEGELLSLVVNKFGDPDRPTGASVCHLLTQLLSQHPMMKAVVARQVEDLLFRPNLPSRAQYYAVCFLSHLQLTKSDAELASQLIGIYFRIFSGSKGDEKKVTKKKVVIKGKRGKSKPMGKIDEHAPQNSKLIAVILSGVNRAVQYANLADPALLKNVDSLYTIVHTGSLAISVQALHLLYQLLMSSQSGGELTQRFYTALYAKLFDPDVLLASDSKLHVLFNVLFRSVKADENVSRARAFAKRLLQIAAVHTPCVAAAVLYLISELRKGKPTILANGVSFDEEEEEKEVDVKEQGRRSGRYDPLHRNPLFANASVDSVFELTLFLDHYHPSVQIFAQSLRDGKSISYDGDPLADFSLVRFLDRFIHRKPKTAEAEPITTGNKIKAEEAEDSLFRSFDEAKLDSEKTTEKAKVQRNKNARKTANYDEEVSDSEFDAFLNEHEDELLDEMSELDESESEDGGESPSKKKRKSSEELLEESEEGDDDYDDMISEDEGGEEDDPMMDSEDGESDGDFSDDGNKNAYRKAKNVGRGKTKKI